VALRVLGDEARALVQQVAATVTTTPALDTFLGNIAAEDRRRDERRRVAPGEAATILRRCGVTGLAPGKASIGATCVAHLSADSLALRVVALVGAGTAAGRRRSAGADPAVRPRARRAHIRRRPGVLERRAVEDGRAAVLARARRRGAPRARRARDAPDRPRQRVPLRSFWVDFQHYPEGVDDLVPFLDETERQAELLRGGTLIPGVRGEAVRLGR
jgi:hypothetical protein